MNFKNISTVVLGLVALIPAYQFFSTENYRVLPPIKINENICGDFKDGGLNNYVSNSLSAPSFLAELENMNKEQVYLSSLYLFYAQLLYVEDPDNISELGNDINCASAYHISKCESADNECFLKLWLPHALFPQSPPVPYVFTLSMQEQPGINIDVTDEQEIGFEGLFEVNTQYSHGITFIRLTAVDPGQNQLVQKRYECSRDIANLGQWRGKVKCVFGF